MSRRSASNVAPERQISCTTIQHAIIDVVNHRVGSFRIPVGVIRNGHRTLPEPSSVATSVRQGSPKRNFCDIIVTNGINHAPFSIIIKDTVQCLAVLLLIDHILTYACARTCSPSSLNELLFCSIFEGNQLHVMIDTKHCLIWMISLLKRRGKK